MTRNTRLAFGAASLLPALATAALPDATSTLRFLVRSSEASLSGTVLLLIVTHLSALGVVLYVAWLAAGSPEHGFGWTLGWVLGLVTSGVVAAPAFWYVYVRRDELPSSLAGQALQVDSRRQRLGRRA